MNLKFFKNFLLLIDSTVYLTHRGNNVKFEYFSKNRNCPRVPLRWSGWAIWWKNQHSKISWHCPFNLWTHITRVFISNWSFFQYQNFPLVVRKSAVWFLFPFWLDLFRIWSFLIPFIVFGDEYSRFFSKFLWCELSSLKASAKWVGLSNFSWKTWRAQKCRYSTLKKWGDLLSQLLNTEMYLIQRQIGHQYNLVQEWKNLIKYYWKS